jgi:hypothetical protein
LKEAIICQEDVEFFLNSRDGEDVSDDNFLKFEGQRVTGDGTLGVNHRLLHVQSYPYIARACRTGIVTSCTYHHRIPPMPRQSTKFTPEFPRKSSWIGENIRVLNVSIEAAQHMN